MRFLLLISSESTFVYQTRRYINSCGQEEQKREHFIGDNPFHSDANAMLKIRSTYSEEKTINEKQ
jgi:hypothetical protein